ncbi:type II secretion system F family protein, partial [Patescibacteria group bacterium]
VNMVDIGEVSGTLEDTLRELTQQMKKSYKLRSKVKGAMTYPIVILVAMLGITAGLIVFVLPKLLDIFKEFGDVQLPIATRILIAVTDFVNNNGLLVAVSFITVVGGLFWFGKTKVGKNIFHMFFIRVPAIGPVVRKVQLAVFTRTLSSLLKTDIPVVQALEITSGVTGNVHYKNAILSTGELIQKGGTISQSLEDYPLLFPPLVVQMTLVGERSGNVDGLLSDIAEFYEAQVDNILDSLSSIIEPILILMLGGMVGGIALAVMTPMYSLTEHISS